MSGIFQEPVQYRRLHLVGCAHVIDSAVRLLDTFLASVCTQATSTPTLGRCILECYSQYVLSLLALTIQEVKLSHSSIAGAIEPWKLSQICQRWHHRKVETDVFGGRALALSKSGTCRILQALALSNSGNYCMLRELAISKS